MVPRGASRSKSDPAQQSTSQQFPAAKGAGGRGKGVK